MLATKSELYYYPEEVYEIPKKKDLKNRQTKKNNKKSRSNAGLKTMLLFSGLIIMGISLFILIRYANITRARMELTQMENQKIELKKTKVDLLAELEGIKSSQNIVDQAVNKLGMNYPEKAQIAYVSVMDDNLVGNLANEIKDENPGKLFSLISSLF